jgi:hypothetical protein
MIKPDKFPTGTGLDIYLPPLLGRQLLLVACTVSSRTHVVSVIVLAYRAKRGSIGLTTRNKANVIVCAIIHHEKGRDRKGKERTVQEVLNMLDQQASRRFSEH